MCVDQVGWLLDARRKSGGVGGQVVISLSDGQSVKRNSSSGDSLGRDWKLGGKIEDILRLLEMRLRVVMRAGNDGFAVSCRSLNSFGTRSSVLESRTGL